MAFRSRGLPSTSLKLGSVSAQKSIQPRLYRSLDIIAATAGICFLAPVFALIALAGLQSGKHSQSLQGYGLDDLLQLFRVVRGEVTLFGRD